MRNLVKSVAVVLALASVGLGADLASVVPEDAFLYLEVNDAPGLWSDFQVSGLRDIVRAVPQAEFGLGLANMFVRQQVFQQFGITWNDFSGKFLRHFALVVTEVGGQEPPEPIVLLDVAGGRAELERLIKKNIEPGLMARRKDLQFADERVGDVALRLLKAQDRSIAYGFLGDVLVVGTRGWVHKLIDARVRPPLAGNATFKAVRERLAVPKGISAYLNFGKLLADHAEQLKANPELAANLDRAGISTIEWIAASSAFDGRGVRDKLFIHTGERKVGLLSLIGSLTPGASLLRFMEETANVEGLMRLDEGRQQILMYFGIRFDEEVVEALGGEIFLAADPSLVPEFIEKKRELGRDDRPFILGLRVAKPDLLKTTIHKFITSQPMLGQGVMRNIEDYKGHEINVLSLPARANRPAYAFVGDYLLIARSAEVIRKCIDAKLGGESLAKRPRYRVVAERVPKTRTRTSPCPFPSRWLASCGGPAPPSPRKRTA